MVYKLVAKHKREGQLAYKTKKPGRPRLRINQRFVKKVIKLRKDTDYGSEKLHFTLKKQGFNVSQHIIQTILDDNKLTDLCPNRRGQRKYVRYQWPISNYMWHTDWSFLDGKWHISYTDDRSRRIMAAADFDNATEENAIFLLYQAILMNEVCPVVILTDKGTQFYNSKKNKEGELTPSLFEQELNELGIQFWTSRRNHPQTNGKQEKLFDTMKKWLKKHPDMSLQDFVEFYNKQRIHHALGYKTPEEVYWENV